MQNANTKLAVGIILVAFLCLAMGCTDLVSTYYPLEMGNEWRFSTTMLDTGEVKEDVELIVRRWEDNFHFNNGQKLILFRNHGILDKNGIYVLRLPIRKDFRWTDRGIELGYTDVAKRVTVPAGNFSECVEVTWDTKSTDGKRNFRSVISYAPGVGPVLYQYGEVLENDTLKPLIRSELVSYRFGTK